MLRFPHKLKFVGDPSAEHLERAVRETNTLLNQPKIESFVENVSGNRKGVVWQRPEGAGCRGVCGVRATRAEALRGVRRAEGARERRQSRPERSREPQRTPLAL